jgi:hypothetical protein
MFSGSGCSDRDRNWALLWVWSSFSGARVGLAAYPPLKLGVRDRNKD